MYTQCPECESSFRVTADVLRQAAGMVRCGSCGNAFNSLDYLSEQKPGPREPEQIIPELRPDPAETPQNLQPKRISADQSAALLKTLDQLAGEDIRIEDTGVEWRVLDDDESGDEEPEDVATLVNDPEVTNAYRLDDFDDEITIVEDEETGEYRAERSGTHEAAGPNAEDTHNSQLFVDSTDMAVENVALFAESETEVDELLQGNGSSTPIDEVLHEGPEAVESSEVFNGAEEMRFDDNTPLPDDFLDDDDAFSHATAKPAPVAADQEHAGSAAESVQTEFALGNPEDWEQLLSEVDDLLSPDAGETDSMEGSSDSSEQSADTSIDDELMSAAFDNEPKPEAREFDGADTSIDDDLMSAAFEIEEQADSDESPESAVDDSPLGDALDEASRLAASLNESLDDEDDTAPAEESLETAEDDEDDSVEMASPGIDDAGDEDEATETVAAEPEDSEEIELAADVDVDGDDDKLDLSEILETDNEALDDEALEDEAQRSADDELPEIIELEDEREARDQHVVPPMTEEEETINMLIDQDLLAIAHEDDEGFTSTIVFGPENQPVKVETVIIGEGEDDGHEDRDRVDASNDDAADADRGEDSVILGLIRGEASGEEVRKRIRPALTLVAVVVLGLGLAGQAIHQQRESLATNPMFSKLLTPVYAAIGKPITPDWDVSAWDIARTRGATDDEDRLLTIYSEIRNTSDKPLPYPVVTLSLTDRFQDSIGALVLEPADYLASALRAGDMVAPGTRFEARIPISEPSPEAIGYTINTCYRTASGDLRCAVDDFR